jgi:hypothetical protein
MFIEKISAKEKMISLLLGLVVLRGNQAHNTTNGSPNNTDLPRAAMARSVPTIYLVITLIPKLFE